MISVVTGTLNRADYLENLIANTVEADDRIELVLVDGGSTDGTIEFIETFINHPRIKLIKHGERSSYPHYIRYTKRIARTSVPVERRRSFGQRLG